jgi:hypothetical protein
MGKLQHGAGFTAMRASYSRSVVLKKDADEVGAVIVLQYMPNPIILA